MGKAEDLKLLEEFSRFADGEISTLLQEVNNEALPHEIYHYTDDIGLDGILNSGALRFTDIFGVNDPSELKHGFSHALKVLQNLSMNGSSLEKKFVERFFKLYQDQLQKTAHFFICAFSKLGDDLSQWRAYANNGRGYALVFDTAILEDAFIGTNGKRSDSNTVFSIRYDDAEIYKIHSKLVHAMFNLIKIPLLNKYTEAELNVYEKELSKTLSAHLIHSSLFFKHEAYKPEQEYRFMQVFRGDMPAPNLKQRPRSFEMINYRDFNWKDVCGAALKKVLIGPSADPNKAESFARGRLDKSGFHNVVIEKSVIPYRAL